MNSIDEADIDMSKYKRRLKNLTVYQSHMEKLESLGQEIIPDSWKGKRGVNKSVVAEILVGEFMKSQNKE